MRLTVLLAIRGLNVNYCTSVTLKGTGWGTDKFFLKTSAPLSLRMTYRMSLLSAGSISLDSTLNLSQAKALEAKFRGSHHGRQICQIVSMPPPINLSSILQTLVKDLKLLIVIKEKKVI